MPRQSSRLLLTSAAVALNLFICIQPILTLAKPGLFTPPAGRGLPGRREPGGVRGRCLEPALVTGQSPDQFPQSYKTLAALTPASDKSIGLTVSEYPTFFWYMPNSKPDYPNKVEFKLMDQEKKIVYFQTILDVSGKAGVMSYSLPNGFKPANSKIPALEVNKVYYWSINVICDLEDRSSEDFVEGYIQRVAPSSNLTQRLTKAVPRDVPEIYAGAGIWHDALTTLAALRLKNPNDPKLVSTWANLIEAIDFGKLAREPLSQ